MAVWYGECCAVAVAVAVSRPCEVRGPAFVHVQRHGCRLDRQMAGLALRTAAHQQQALVVSDNRLGMLFIAVSR